MQSNAAELTHRLLGALDDGYNVVDMPAVVEIISLLEKVVITKELLETTRLGKHVNELRRKTTNEQLSKRAKGLLKKWRSMVLPDSNGQAKTSPPLPQPAGPEPPRGDSPTAAVVSPPAPAPPKASPQVSPTLGAPNQNSDVNLNQVKSNKKRSAKDSLENVNVKRPRANGVTDFDFSDNSNSSFKDVIGNVKAEPKREVIVINSDSNSSAPDKVEPSGDALTPKKRGRKKGSKNHKNLLDEAETSFSNKLAVSASRGNSKVKTTQELLASIQNKNSIVKPKEDLIEKAAKLTERVSIIDQKLNTNASRNKNSLRGMFSANKNERVIESGSVINDKSLVKPDEEEIIVVDDIETDEPDVKEESPETVKSEDTNAARSLTVEEAFALLPPIDSSVLYEEDDEPVCTCYLKENKSDFSIDDEDVETGPPFEFVEDPECRARVHLENKYQTSDTSEERVHSLHTTNIPNVNGNFGLGPAKPEPQLTEDGLYANVVPNIYERLDKDVAFEGENYRKYSVSETDDRTGGVFREWYECVEEMSYEGDALKILPYVVID